MPSKKFREKVTVPRFSLALLASLAVKNWTLQFACFNRKKNSPEEGCCGIIGDIFCLLICGRLPCQTAYPSLQ